jgi:hypothetical protein
LNLGQDGLRLRFRAFQQADDVIRPLQLSQLNDFISAQPY